LRPQAGNPPDLVFVPSANAPAYCFEVGLNESLTPTLGFFSFAARSFQRATWKTENRLAILPAATGCSENLKPLPCLLNVTGNIFRQMVPLSRTTTHNKGHTPRMDEWAKEAYREIGRDGAAPKTSAAPYTILPKFYIDLADWFTQTEKRDVDFLFVGSLSPDRATYWNRQWVSSFARSHFTSASYLQYTDNNTRSSGYKSLGDYDHTLNEKGFVPKEQKGLHPVTRGKTDIAYGARMARAQCCLCPAGDAPYSMRFYEALMFKCLPIVNSSSHTFRTKEEASLDYKYYLSSEASFEYRSDWAEHNYRLFRNYHSLHPLDKNYTDLHAVSAKISGSTKASRGPERSNHGGSNVHYLKRPLSRPRSGRLDSTIRNSVGSFRNAGSSSAAATFGWDRPRITATASSRSFMGRLKELKAARESGLLSEEEFGRTKASLVQQHFSGSPGLSSIGGQRNVGSAATRPRTFGATLQSPVVPLITGCGRSGTHSIAKLLSNMGIPAIHEGASVGSISVSWFYAPMNSVKEFNRSDHFANLYGTGINLAVLDKRNGPFQFSPIVHITREPRAHIEATNRCICREGTYLESSLGKNFSDVSWAYAARYIALGNSSGIARSAKYWLFWNIMVERSARFHFRIEDLNPRALVAALGLEARAQVPGDGIPTSLQVHEAELSGNSRSRRSVLDWETLRDYAGAQMVARICLTAKKYGYSYNNSGSCVDRGAAVAKIAASRTRTRGGGGGGGRSGPSGGEVRGLSSG
jgi:hypothetical protein